MGREVRRVPADWEHPKDVRGRAKPLHGHSYEKALADWIEGRAKWQEGYREVWSFEDEAPKEWKPIELEHAGLAWEQWSGDAPQFSDYMPEWLEAERTHLQMYETCTEGTPISPVMDNPEALARWLADNSASAFGDMTATYDQWLATINRGGAVSAVMTVAADGKGGTMESGVAAMAEMD